MKIDELNKLIEKLETVQEGSRELDAEIYRITTKESSALEQIECARQELGREPSDDWKQLLPQSGTTNAMLLI